MLRSQPRECSFVIGVGPEYGHTEPSSNRKGPSWVISQSRDITPGDITPGQHRCVVQISVMVLDSSTTGLHTYSGLMGSGSYLRIAGSGTMFPFSSRMSRLTTGSSEISSMLNLSKSMYANSLPDLSSCFFWASEGSSIRNHLRLYRRGMDSDTFFCNDFHCACFSASRNPGMASPGEYPRNP